MKHEGRASHRAAFPATISQLFQAFYLHNPELVVAVPGKATLEVVSTQVVSSPCLFWGTPWQAEGGHGVSPGLGPPGDTFSTV